MGSYVFDKLTSRIMKGEVSFLTVVDNSYKLALVTSAAFNNMSTGALSNAQVWNDVSGVEITENISYNKTGYSHQNLINIKMYEKDDSNGFTEVLVSASDIVFPVSTIDANGAIIYTNDASKTLVCAIDFGQKISSNNGVFIVELSKNGWLRLKNLIV